MFVEVTEDRPADSEDFQTEPPPRLEELPPEQFFQSNEVTGGQEKLSLGVLSVGVWGVSLSLTSPSLSLSLLLSLLPPTGT